MSTSATGSAEQSDFPVVRIPLRSLGHDSPTIKGDKSPGPRGPVASVSDRALPGARNPSAAATGDDQARLTASMPAAATDDDVELERLRKCLSALHEEIETLPRAAQLPPIPGLPLLHTRMTDSDPGAIEPGARNPTLSPRRPRKALSPLAMFLIASALAVPAAGYYAAGSFARLVDEFDTLVRPSIDPERVGLLHLPQVERLPRANESIASGSGAERAVQTISLQPTTDFATKPAAEDAASPQAVQGLENGPPAGGPGVTEETTPVDQAPSQSDAGIVLDTEDIKPLIDRGRQFFDAGDVAAARLLFNRAASAGDVTAAIALGTTYDPAVLESRGVRGMSADPQKARSWYEKAAESGSAEGLRLLKALDGKLAATRQTAERVDSDATPSFAMSPDPARVVQHDLLWRRQPAQYFKPKH